MTVNYIWLDGSSSRDLGSKEYPFISITPRSTLTQSGSTSFGPIGQLDLFVNYLH